MTLPDLALDAPATELFPQFKSDIYELISTEVTGLTDEQLDFDTLYGHAAPCEPLMIEYRHGKKNHAPRNDPERSDPNVSELVLSQRLVCRAGLCSLCACCSEQQNPISVSSRFPCVGVLGS